MLTFMKASADSIHVDALIDIFECHTQKQYDDDCMARRRLSKETADVYTSIIEIQYNTIARLLMFQQ